MVHHNLCVFVPSVGGLFQVLNFELNIVQCHVVICGACIYQVLYIEYDYIYLGFKFTYRNSAGFFHAAIFQEDINLLLFRFCRFSHEFSYK